MQDHSNSNPIIYRTLFFTLMVGLAITYLLFSFKGLTSKYGMDQAQIAREVAKGNSMTTKFIRPVALQQLEESDKPIDMYRFYDTTHSPLNILIYAGVIKAFGGDDPAKFAMTKNQSVYALDRIIAGTCVLFFMIAIGINFILISDIFDSKIASITAILMLVSEHFWNYTQSGLPQMLMLAIFSAACYQIWKAIQRQEAGASPTAPVIMSGIMFGLLALAHWMTLWIFLGYILFCITYFKPRGTSAVFVAITVAIFIAGPLIFNAQHSDGPLGTAYYYVNGATGLGQDYGFRQLNLPQMDISNLMSRVVKTTLMQVNQIHSHIGGFFLASGFFLALLHPFKRSSISVFRWTILGMWLSASAGMALYGLSDAPIDPNQMHILFMPMMSAFAIALISVLWARLQLSKQHGGLNLLPFIIIIIISAAPMVISLQDEFRPNQTNKSQTVPGYSPYTHNQILTKRTKETDIVFSDQPWAVAWYADRTAIWLPTGSKELARIETLAEKSNASITGIYLTPSIREGVNGQLYGDLYPLIYNILGLQLGGTASSFYAELHPQTEKLVSPTKGRYNFRIPIVEDPLNFSAAYAYTLYSKVNPVIHEQETKAKD